MGQLSVSLLMYILNFDSDAVRYQLFTIMHYVLFKMLIDERHMHMHSFDWNTNLQEWKKQQKNPKNNE